MRGSSHAKALVYDARFLVPPPSLDREGFALVEHHSAVRDFNDEAEVRRVYYAEAERLLVAATVPCGRTCSITPLRRRPSERPALDSGPRDQTGRRGPVGRVHNDFTAGSGLTRLRHELGQEAEALAGSRFAVVNVWRPIRGPVLDAPLAVCDARSVAPDDLIRSDLIYRDRTGEVYQVKHNPRHRWYYISALRTDEALLLKCYDSEERPGALRAAQRVRGSQYAAPRLRHARASSCVRSCSTNRVVF